MTSFIATHHAQTDLNKKSSSKKNTFKSLSRYPKGSKYPKITILLISGTNDGQTWNNTPATADQQAILMQQVYANYMTQYVQYLQSIGALNGVAWPNQTVGQSLVEQTNQIADEARAGGAVMGKSKF